MWVARRLAAQYFRTYGSPPDKPALRGSLYGSGFAFLFAARAQDLLQMLVSTWLLPTVSLANKVVMTEVPPSALSLRQKQ